MTEPLDLKYRPRRFSEVLGNDGARKALLARSRAGTLAGTSYMFGGPKGCGKTSLARIVARAVSCPSLDNGEPCNECSFCVSVSNDSSLSVEEFDAASHGTVDRMRSLVDSLDFESLDGMRRVVILDEAQRLGPASQDSLLKAMEERRMSVILCTTEPGKIKPALRDRVEEYAVRPPHESMVLSWLESICSAENIGTEPGALAEIVRSCSAHPRSSVNTLDSLASAGPVDLAAVSRVFHGGSFAAVSAMLGLLDRDRVSALALMDDLIGAESPAWVRDAVVLAILAGMRRASGVPSTYRGPLDFYDSRGSGWVQAASVLSSMERPTAVGVEFALLSTSPMPDATSRPYVAPAPSSPLPPPSQEELERVKAIAEKYLDVPVSLPSIPKVTDDYPFAEKLKVSPEFARVQARLATVPPPRPAPPPPPEKRPAPPSSVEIDGVTFSASERLTSLDKKLENSQNQAPPEPPDVRVEFDRTRVPMSDQEFSRAFTSRFGR